MERQDFPPEGARQLSEGALGPSPKSHRCGGDKGSRSGRCIPGTAWGDLGPTLGSAPPLARVGQSPPVEQRYPRKAIVFIISLILGKVTQYYASQMQERKEQ